MNEAEYTDEDLDLFEEFVEARDLGFANMFDRGSIQGAASQAGLDRLASCSKAEYLRMIKEFNELSRALLSRRGTQVR